MMKDTKHQILDEYVNRLKKEAFLKSFLCALAIGFAAVLITALACWLTAFSGYWIFAVALIIPMGATLPLFYFYAFFPSEKYVAKRLDQLGLDERILTMVEFGNQESYIMKRQREDAIAALSKLNSKLVKFSLSAALIVLPVVAADVGLTMTAVYAASEAGVIPSGKELIADLNSDKTTFDLVYRIPEKMKGYGLLYSASNPEGAEEIKLTVGRGQDGEAVMFVAEKGYVFTRWSDAMGGYIRRDTDVQGNIVVVPIAEELGLNIPDDAAEAGEDPRKIGSSEGGDRNMPTDPSDNRDPVPPGEPTPPGGGKDLTTYVFDGQTDYGGIPYEEAYETSMGELTQSGGADDVRKGIAADYMDAIKRG